MSIRDAQRTSAREGASESANTLLVQAGAVLATSLDPRITMSQVASLTVPGLADLCTIDLLARDGSITEAAVASSEPAIATALEELRSRYPLDPAGEHPVARVIRSGQPELQARMDETLLRSFAEGSEHAAFMLEHRYRSAAVAPLLARGRTLGALSTLRLGDAHPYDESDLALISELARRAALAIDNARLFSDLQRIEQRLEAILVNLAEAVTVVDEAGRIVFANEAAAQLFGARSSAELIDGEAGGLARRMRAIDEEGVELSIDTMRKRSLRGGEPLVVRATIESTGKERWLLVRSSPLEDPETGRERWSVNVFEDITEMKRAQLAEAFLADAGATLSSSIDFEETLQLIAKLPVPELADWCAVDVTSDSGELERVAFHPSVEDVDTNRRPGASAVVPMLSAHRKVGELVLGRDRDRPPLTGATLSLAHELGRRAGNALEHARLYTERTRIAHTLQQALLPSSLPAIPAVEIEVRYAAAGELNEAGGDFYDVIECEQGRWLLVIGDVCGKGPIAAGVTALARHTLRAAAIGGQPPLRMLDVLHNALQRQPVGADLCTVCLVSLQRDGEGDGAELKIALAGHPPPLLIDRSGVARPVGKPGTLLGVIDPISVSESDVRLADGETLLLYTDGVAEAGRSSGTLSERGLIELCKSAPELSLASLLDRIEHAAIERAAGMRRDDIALLGVRLARGSHNPDDLLAHTASR
jgi:PAS domain S-box-containing protein